MIGLVGWYGHDNLGDDALALASLRRVRKDFPGEGVVCFSSSPLHHPEFDGVEFLEPPPLRPGNLALYFRNNSGALRQWLTCRLLVLGGGGYFADDLGISAPLKWAILLGVRRLVPGTRLLGYGIGIGPLNSYVGRLSARLAFGGKTSLSVRDPDSAELLHSCRVRSEATVVPDPAFILESSTTEGVSRSFAGRCVYFCPAALGASLSKRARRIANYDNYVRLWASLIEHTASRGLTPILVPFQKGGVSNAESDTHLCLSIQEKCSQTTAVDILSISDPEALIRVFESAHMVFCMRFHSLVFAILAGSPVSGIGYHRKVRSLAASVGLADHFVDIGDVSEARCIDTVSTALENLPNIAAAIAVARPILVAEARQVSLA